MENQTDMSIVIGDSVPREWNAPRLSSRLAVIDSPNRTGQEQHHQTRHTSDAPMNANSAADHY